MDVRCENCQTVYDFDETRVKDAGVTVKCTQCGHIFKVRKRSPAARKRTIPGMPKLDDAAAPPTVASPPPAHVEEPSGRLPSGGPDRVWLLRLASTGEVRRFRELTTLQQWIVEKRVAREDEISRTGDFWKRLGAIAELQPFFRVVEQAARPDAAAYGATDPALPARSGTAPGVGPVAAENAGGGYAPPLS